MLEENISILDLIEGDLLADYQVISVVGRGPIGLTYHVVSCVSGKEFALKAFSINHEIPLEWIDRYEAQASLLSRLNHANIDRVLTSGRVGKISYSLKDFVHDGEGHACNLYQFIEKHGGVLSQYQTSNIIMHVIGALEKALEYKDAHHDGILHGNLKPQNILIAEGKSVDLVRSSVAFEVFVGDFQPYGLITDDILCMSYLSLVDAHSNHPTSQSEKAIEQMLKGIFLPVDYIAPERHENAAPSVSSDIYSLGVIIYEMLTGVLPCGRFPMPNDLRPELSRSWTECIKKTLQVDPKKRYGSYREVREFMEKEFHEELHPVKQGIAWGKPIAIPEKTERRSLTPPGMVYIPAGNFFVGSGHCGEDALPQYECSSSGFYIDRTQVTNGQYAKFIEATGYVTEAEKGEGAPVWMNGEWRVLQGIAWKNPTGEETPENFERHPVTQVTYQDALAYAEWLGHRLPTEEEWEYAARGGQKQAHFPWGNTINRSQANFSSDGTCEVMQYQANGYGLYDMAGNVWEWTGSWYMPYPGNHQVSPHFGQQYRVVRGGAWLYDGNHCMLSYRNANQVEHSYPTLGFRTVYDYVDETQA